MPFFPLYGRLVEGDGHVGERVEAAVLPGPWLVVVEEEVVVGKGQSPAAVVPR